MLHFSHFRSFLLTLLVLCGGFFLLEGCESSSDDLTEEPIIEERDPRFAQCYYDEDLAKNKADSVIQSFFGEKASNSIKLNEELSFIGCDEGDDLESLAFGVEDCCLPRTFDLVYDIIYEGDTVYQIPLFSGSEMNFEFASEKERAKLFPYKLLLRGDIEFDYTALKTEMKEKNMFPEQYEIELVNDTLKANLPNALYWELTYLNEDEEMMFMRVNARNGVFSSLRPMTRMGD